MYVAVSKFPTSQAVIPLTAWTTSQRELWALYTLEANGAALNTGEYTELLGNLDIDAFVRASRQTVEECEALRIRIIEQDGDPLQWVAPIGEWSPAVIDLSDEADPSKAARSWMDAELGRAFNIAQTVFSWTLIKLSDARHFWCLIVHQLANDGSARNQIARRMADNYSQLVGAGAPRTETPGPFSDLLREDAEYRQSEEFKSDRAYWLQRMADLQPPARLTSRGSNGSYMPARYTDRLPASASAAVREIKAKTGVSLSGLFVSLAAVYLRRFTGASDITVGLLVAARTTPIARNIPGTVSNTVPVRLRVDADTTLGDLITQVRARIREALTHQRLPLSEIKAGVPGLKTELYAIATNVMKFDFALKFGALVTTTHNLSNGPVDDVAISVFEQPGDGSLQIALNGNVNRYEAAQLARHYNLLISCLERVCRANLETAVDAIDWISPADRALLVDNGCCAASEAQPADVDEDGADQPNSARELQICNAFARAFGVDAFPVRSNFFEEGGYSLLAARLISDLSTELNVKIPLRTLFEHPTPRALGRYLNGPAPHTTQKSDRPLLVLFPNGGVLMREMIDLRKALEADFSVLFIEYPDWRQDWDVICDVDRYLDFIVSQIKAAAPEPRPLTLAGYSFGASVAYTMHVVLSRLGYTIEQFISVDGRSPVDSTATGRALRLASHVVQASSAAEIVSRIGPSVARALGRFFGAHAKQPVVRAVLGRLGSIIPADDKSKFVFNMTSVLTTALPMRGICDWTVAIAPETRLVDVPVTLFRSTNNGDKWAYDLGWTRLAPKLGIVPLHSDHRTIVDKDNVAIISAHIRPDSSNRRPLQ
jgi:thioesterase domain-containing protein